MIGPFAFIFQMIMQIMMLPLMFAFMAMAMHMLNKWFGLGGVPGGVECVKPHVDEKVWIEACVSAFFARVQKDTVFDTWQEMLVLSSLPVTVTVRWKGEQLTWYKHKVSCYRAEGGWRCEEGELVKSGSTTSKYATFTVEPGYGIALYAEDGEGNTAIAKVFVVSSLA